VSVKLAAQESTLPGDTLEEKFEFTLNCGFDGIELAGQVTATRDPVHPDHPGSVQPGQLGGDLPRDAQPEDRDGLSDVDVGIQHHIEPDRADLGEDAHPRIDAGIQDPPAGPLGVQHGERPVTPSAPDPVTD